MTRDVEYMQHAIRLAEKGRYTTAPNPAVGCVIVKDAQVIGEGWHRRAGEAHAEVNALQQAGAAAKDAAVYVTLEPCSHTGKTPPCADALIAAGVKKVVVAMKDPNPLVAGSGIKKLQAAGISVDTGLLEAQARALNPGFIKRMEQGRPLVRIKLAMSLDGRTAMASGESKWISSEASRDDVQRLRAESSAVLTGIGTVLADDPSMNVRLTAAQLNLDAGLAVRQPKRIVVDSNLRMPKAARILADDAQCIVYTTLNVEKKADYPFIIETCAAPDGVEGGKIDLTQMMRNLAEREINLLHVEAGSVLCGALLKNDLVDEIIIYMAPHIMGDAATGLFHLPGLDQMAGRFSLAFKDVRAVGPDIRITVVPQTGSENGC